MKKHLHLAHLLFGKAVTWDKTMHAFPSAAQLQAAGRAAHARATKKALGMPQAA